MYDVFSDLEILIQRAFLNKEVTAFGVDGNGEYGTSYYAEKYWISKVEFGNYMFHGDLITVFLVLDGYDPDRHGRVDTDKNLERSLNEHLKTICVSPEAWSFNPLCNEKIEEPNTCALLFNVKMTVTGTP